jgi:ABC-type amino acid transport system permease subunit
MRPTSGRLRFLDFLNGVIGDSGKTIRLAFLVCVTAAAVGVIVQLIRIDQQWIWVLLSTLGAGGAAKWWQKRESKTDPK